MERRVAEERGWVDGRWRRLGSIKRASSRPLNPDSLVTGIGGAAGRTRSSGPKTSPGAPSTVSVICREPGVSGAVPRSELLSIASYPTALSTGGWPGKDGEARARRRTSVCSASDTDGWATSTTGQRCDYRLDVTRPPRGDARLRQSSTCCFPVARTQLLFRLTPPSCRGRVSDPAEAVVSRDPVGPQGVGQFGMALSCMGNWSKAGAETTPSSWQTRTRSDEAPSSIPTKFIVVACMAACF
jgi:hypothetical protein